MLFSGILNSQPLRKSIFQTMLKILKKSAERDFSNNEELLIRAIGESDESAFRYIYSEYYDTVSRFICQRGGQEEDARDIFQEAIMSAWHNIKEGKYESKGHFKTYLVQVCKFKWYDRLKSGSAQNTELTWNPPDSPDGPDRDEMEEREEKINELLQYYNQIDEKCRTLLKLFYFEKKSFNQVAKIMGVTPNSAKNQKYRCINKIKELFKTTRS
jgi:RNA polymerase sigma factor (sigma-70 family)